MKIVFRSLFLIFLSIIFFSCTPNVSESHHHFFSTEWSYDEDFHWHEATCGCGDEIVEKINHNITESKRIEATATKEGEITYCCLDCEYTYTETTPNHSHEYLEEWTCDKTSHWHNADCGIESHRSQQGNHWWDDGAITQDPTENIDGIKIYTCKICCYQKTESIAKLSHEHSFSQNFTFDSKYHWKESTCEHTGIKADFEPHKWSNLTVIAATASEDGKNKYTCETCNAKKTETLHWYDLNEWKYNAEFHWNPSTCSHGAQLNLSFHDFTISSEDDEKITYKCTTCKYTITEQKNTYISDTLHLEIPTCKGFSNADASDHQVRTFHYYTICYRESYEESEWSAYKLTRNDLLGTTKRIDSFRHDNAILTGTVSQDVYTNSGFQKGHLTPAADMKRDDFAMYDSFYISNVCPQYSSLNTGKWSTLEKEIRNWCSLYGQVYVVTGPILEKPAYEYNALGTTDKIIIPEYFYKVIFTYKTDEEGNHTPMAIGFIMPNNKCDNDLSYYAVSVDTVESRTGLDFFSALDDSIETQIEAFCDFNSWN